VILVCFWLFIFVVFLRHNDKINVIKQLTKMKPKWKLVVFTSLKKEEIYNINVVVDHLKRVQNRRNKK